MRCLVCGRGPHTGTSLFRQNEKGVPGVWACEEHNKVIVDPETAELVAIIESDGRTKQ